MLWNLASILFIFGFLSLVREIHRLMEEWSFKKHSRSLREVVSICFSIEEILGAGSVPSPAQWESLERLPAPWKQLASSSLNDLRAAGASIVPTLIRLRNLASDHLTTLTQAHARASQSFAQAMFCSLFVPLLGVAFYYLIPEIEANPIRWLFACAGAWSLTGVGAIWLIHLASAARWGGLVGEKRKWLLGAQCAGEKFLALVRSGVPPDLAWIQVGELLQSITPSLMQLWGSSVWMTHSYNGKNSAEQVLVEAGSAIKKSVQVSLMEGRGCTEKVEAALLALRRDIQSNMDRELSLLGTRVLKPLFICVAPGLFSLLGFGLYLAAEDSLKEVIHVF